MNDKDKDKKDKKMALTYSQLVTASVDPTFQNRVGAAVLTACINIAVDAPVSALDNRRDRFARQLLNDPVGAVVRFALPVALGFGNKSDEQLDDATDAELDTRVASIFNDLIV
jgi:hypothetical protein